MSSVCKAALGFFLFGMAATGSSAAAELCVCADPGNLPYSNSQQQGYENQLARMVAHDLGRTVRYVWGTQRGDYLRKTLEAGRCDMVMAVPAKIEEVQPTEPYYRSSYAFVTRRDRHLTIHSFDDARLRSARIGVHVLQHDDATVPPAQALMDRGLTSNIVWYKLFPDFTRANPPAALIEAVERGEIDVAVAWGPMAGYFARHAPVSLDVVPVAPQFEHGVPLAFDIAMGVRRGDTKLMTQLNTIIERRRNDIHALLDRYGVPVLKPEVRMQGASARTQRE